MKLAFEFNATNIFNQHAIMSYMPNPFAQNNEWLAFAGAANPLKTDVLKFMTGYDVAAEATAEGLVKNSRYGMPFLFQSSRTLRLGVRFTF